MRWQKSIHRLAAGLHCNKHCARQGHLFSCIFQRQAGMLANKKTQHIAQTLDAHQMYCILTIIDRRQSPSISTNSKRSTARPNSTFDNIPAMTQHGCRGPDLSVMPEMCRHRQAMQHQITCTVATCGTDVNHVSTAQAQRQVLYLLHGSKKQFSNPSMIPFAAAFFAASAQASTCT